MTACPDCPMCGHPPRFIMSSQGFCGTDDCLVMAWNINRTRAENIAHANEVTSNGDDE